MKWDYHVERWFVLTDQGQGSNPTDRAGRNLQKLGEEGWELVGSIEKGGEAPDYKSQATLIFKRQQPE
jgi:hypothetical protein